MLIKDLMCIIWKGKNDLYKKLYKEAAGYSEEVLFQRVSNKKMTHYSYPGTNMNLFSCTVCIYRLNNNFGGCSMCNYEDDLEYQACMSLLREKNSTLYAKAILYSFQNVRGKNTIPNAFELLSSYDVLNSNEFPEEVFQELFINNHLFTKKPFGYIFETRGSSITMDRLNQLKKYLPKENRIYIEFGVEVGNEWIRNHWLNKDLSNKQVKAAISNIHEAGFQASADILIGIPGLTEEQSITLFIETIMWLEQLGIDQYVVLPLNRKSLTLQGIFYEYLANDGKLVGMGLSQGEHTGIPWLTTIIKAIDILFDINPGFVKKINLAQVYSHQNSVENVTPYNKTNCRCNNKIIAALWSYQNRRDKNVIKQARLYSESKQHECYQDYDTLINLQRQCVNIPTTVRTIFSRLSEHVWSGDSADKRLLFDKELEQYSFGD